MRATRLITQVIKVLTMKLYPFSCCCCCPSLKVIYSAQYVLVIMWGTKFYSSTEQISFCVSNVKGSEPCHWGTTRFQVKDETDMEVSCRLNKKRRTAYKGWSSNFFISRRKNTISLLKAESKDMLQAARLGQLLPERWFRNQWLVFGKMQFIGKFIEY